MWKELVVSYVMILVQKYTIGSISVVDGPTDVTLT